MLNNCIEDSDKKLLVRQERIEENGANDDVALEVVQMRNSPRAPPSKGALAPKKRKARSAPPKAKVTKGSSNSEPCESHCNLKLTRGRNISPKCSSPRRRSTSSGASSLNRTTRESYRQERNSPSHERATKRNLSKERWPKGKNATKANNEPLRKKSKISQPKGAKKTDSSEESDHFTQSIENVLRMSESEIMSHFKFHTKDNQGKNVKKPKKTSSIGKRVSAEKSYKSALKNKENSNAAGAEEERKKSSVAYSVKKRGRPKGSKNKKKVEDKPSKVLKRLSKKRGKDAKSIMESRTSLTKSKSVDSSTSHSSKIATEVDCANTKLKTIASNKDSDPVNGPTVSAKKKVSKGSSKLSSKVCKPKMCVQSNKVKSNKIPIRKVRNLSCLPVKKRINSKKIEEEKPPSPHPQRVINKSAKTKWKHEDTSCESDDESKTPIKKEPDDDGVAKKCPKSPKRKSPTKIISKKEPVDSTNSSDDEDYKVSNKPLKKVIKDKWKKEQKKQDNNKKKPPPKKLPQSSILPKKRKVTFSHERRASPKYYKEESDLTDSEDEITFKHFSESRTFNSKKDIFKKEPSPPRRKPRIASLNAMAVMQCINEDAKIQLPSLPRHPPKESMAIVLQESTIARRHSDDSDSEWGDESPHISSFTRTPKKRSEEDSGKDKRKRKRRRNELDGQMGLRDMVYSKRIASLNASAIMACYSESRGRKVRPAESEVTNVDIKRKISYESMKDRSTKTRSVITVQETTKKVKKAQGSRETEVEEHIIVKKKVKRQSDIDEVADNEPEDDGAATDTSEIDQDHLLPKSPESGMIVESTITYVTTHTHTIPKTVSVSGVSKYSISSSNGKSTIRQVQQVQRKCTSANASSAEVSLPASPPPPSLPHHSQAHSGSPQSYSPLGALSVMQPVMHPHPPSVPPPPPPHSYHPPPQHHLPPTSPYSHLQSPLQASVAVHHQFHLGHPPPYPLTPHSPPYPPPPRSGSSTGSSPVCSSSPSTTPRPLSSPQSNPSPHPSLGSSGYGTSPNNVSSNPVSSTPYPHQRTSTSSTSNSVVKVSGSQPSPRLQSPYSEERVHHPQSSPSSSRCPSEQRHHSAFTAPIPSTLSPASVSSHSYQPVSGPMPTGESNTSPATYKPPPPLPPAPYSAPSRLNSPPSSNKYYPPTSDGYHPPSLSHPQSFQGYPYHPYDKLYGRGHPYHFYQAGYPHGGQYPHPQGVSEYPPLPPHPPPPHSSTGPPAPGSSTLHHYSLEGSTNNGNYSRTLCVPAPPFPAHTYNPQLSQPPPPLGLPPPPSAPSSSSASHHPSYHYPDYAPIIMYPSTGTIIKINYIGPPPPAHGSLCCSPNSKNVSLGPLTGGGKGPEKMCGNGSPYNYHCYGGCPPYPHSQMQYYHNTKAPHPWQERKPILDKELSKKSIPPLKAITHPDSLPQGKETQSEQEVGDDTALTNNDKLPICKDENTMQDKMSSVDKSLNSVDLKLVNGKCVTSQSNGLPGNDGESSDDAFQSSSSSNPKDKSSSLQPLKIETTQAISVLNGSLSSSSNVDSTSSAVSEASPALIDVKASNGVTKDSSSETDESATSTTLSLSPLSSGEQVLPTSSACPITVPHFQSMPHNSRKHEPTTWVVPPSASNSEGGSHNGNSSSLLSSSGVAHLSSSTTITMSTSVSNTSVSTNSVMSTASPLLMTAESRQKNTKNESDTLNQPLFNELSSFKRQPAAGKDKSKIDNLLNKGTASAAIVDTNSRSHLLCYYVPPCKNVEVIPKVKVSNDSNQAKEKQQNESKNNCDKNDSQDCQPRKRGRPPKAKEVLNSDANDAKESESCKRPKKTRASPTKDGKQIALEDEPKECNNGSKSLNDGSLQSNEDSVGQKENSSNLLNEKLSLDLDSLNDDKITESESNNPTEKLNNCMEKKKFGSKPSKGEIKNKVHATSGDSKLNEFFHDPPLNTDSGTLLTKLKHLKGDSSLLMSVPTCVTSIGAETDDVKPSSELTLNIKTEFMDKIKLEKISPKQNIPLTSNSSLMELEKIKFLNGDSELAFKNLMPSPDQLEEASRATLINQILGMNLTLEQKAALLFSTEWDKTSLKKNFPAILANAHLEPPSHTLPPKCPPQNHTKLSKNSSKSERRKKRHSAKARRAASLLASLKERNSESDASSVDLDLHSPQQVSGDAKKACKKKDELKKNKPIAFPMYNPLPPRRRRSSGSLKGKVMKKPKYIHGWSWEGEAHEGKIWLTNDEPVSLRKCYTSMKHREGDSIRVRDCVLLKSGHRKTDLPYVAKVAALWEDPETSDMMMSILWYYRPEHTESGRKEEDLADEIFASKHRDHLSVACIDDRCYVLTFNEYCRYRRLLRLFQEGAPPISSPVPDAEGGYGRVQRQPPGRVVSELLFFCRKVYDYRQKRILKNPPC